MFLCIQLTYNDSTLYKQTYRYTKFNPSEIMTREKFGRPAVLFTVPVEHDGVIVPIAKPSHAEASVLCKVLGTVRTILLKIVRGFLTKSMSSCHSS